MKIVGNLIVALLFLGILSASLLMSFPFHPTGRITPIRMLIKKSEPVWKNAWELGKSALKDLWNLADTGDPERINSGKLLILSPGEEKIISPGKPVFMKFEPDGVIIRKGNVCVATGAKENCFDAEAYRRRNPGKEACYYTGTHWFVLEFNAKTPTHVLARPRGSGPCVNSRSQTLTLSPGTEITMRPGQFEEYLFPPRGVTFLDGKVEIHCKPPCSWRGKFGYRHEINVREYYYETKLLPCFVSLENKNFLYKFKADPVRGFKFRVRQRDDGPCVLLDR